MMSPSSDSSEAAKAPYKDDDLVYVDPETRTVVGLVEWSKTGDKPLSKAYVAPTVTAAPSKGKGKDESKRSFWRRMYPWGTYRSMKRIFKVEGKIKDAEPNKTLEEVLPKALNEAFWKW
ncbi:hypothetical protein EXS65_01140 [Candidatus Peribacteria bacterium]|nr:hypothetical protein [Candidatus Peribacteria bacterium]